MRIAYFDCVAGISGEMALGALVDAGADFDVLRARLTSLPLEPFSIEREEVESYGIRATRLQIRAGVRGVIRTYASIRALLDASDLPEDVRHTANRIFRRLAEAEARVHRKEVDLVTFHELGEVDAVADIAGTALALSMLGVERVFSSPVPTGLGMVRTEHGASPIPGPTVVELLRGAPLYSRGTPFELVTPTGAAILAALVEGYGDLPLMRVEGTGYGAGIHRLDFPNVLRVLVGEAEARVVPLPVGERSGRVTVEVALVGPTAEDHGAILERAIAAGAEDAWLSPVVTREGEGVRVTAICLAGRESAVREAIAGRPAPPDPPRGVEGGPELRLVPGPRDQDRDSAEVGAGDGDEPSA